MCSQVAYHPTPSGGGDTVTLGELGTLARSGGYGREAGSQPLLGPGLDRRVVIGCQDTNRIVL